MPAELQSKLLRFVQDRKFSPLGSTRVIDADVRIIAASSRASADKGPNVQDALLGRLGAQPVQLPPLRERLEDLPRLIAYFLGEIGEISFVTEVFQALFLHTWPLNIRELQKTIAEAKILSRGADSIGFEHLPESIVALTAATPDEIYGELPAEAESPDADGIVEEVAEGANTARTRRPPPTAEELTALMRHYHGNITYVARHLKRQYAVIWRCLQRYGISADAFKPSGDRS
jgi:DNA-binding NtrC family response regulator